MVQTRPSTTTGVERPMKFALQIRFSPSGDQLEIRPASVETPS